MKIFLIKIILFVATFKNVAAAGNRTLPESLKLGAATSAYQVEGGWNENGKSESNWDRISHTLPSTIAHNDTGDVACDSFHKYKEDVAMLKLLGLNYYRFSLSWARIVPKGLAGSEVNMDGIAYYRDLMKELISNGIEPMVTIFHWDMPQILEDIGGWKSPQLIDHFVWYSRVVFEQLGDLSQNWATFNEPKQTCFGTARSGISDYLCAHNILKAHAQVYHMYDEEFRNKQKGVISIVANSDWYEPASNSDKDLEAQERGMQFSVSI